jgi:hypothetical protein
MAAFRALYGTVMPTEDQLDEAELLREGSDYAESERLAQADRYYGGDP